MQTTNKVFMVRPCNFNYNNETAINNSFQKNNCILNSQKLALKEFNNYLKLLKNNKVKVIVVDDTNNPYTPDSIFPNNWFSTHQDGTFVLYSMYANNRRKERKKVFIDKIKENTNITKTLDLTVFEKENLFLEGTGSLVLDRDNKIAYACKSPRTSTKLINIFACKLGYKKIIFNAYDENNKPIYHTNVLLSICKDFVIICLDAIKDDSQKEQLIKSFELTKKKVISISYKQLNNFAGNVLEIKNKYDERLILMSLTAKNSLNKKQLRFIESKCKIISPDIKTIERLGGGSARCMIAELFC